jgi:hypothetical protein
MKQVKTFSGYNREHVEKEANDWIRNQRVNVIDFRFEDKSTLVEKFLR